MIVLVVVATALVAAVAGAVGAWLGGRRLGRALVLATMAWLAGGAAVVLAWRNGWFRPLGLVTPLVVGVCVMLLVVTLLGGVWRRSQSPAPEGRLLGSVLGATVGLYVAAVGWMLGGVVADASARVIRADALPPVAARDDATAAAWRELLHTADRGFVRHLPFVGDLSRECEALIYVLDAPAEARQVYANQQHWGELAELPSCRELLQDAAFGRDVDDLRAGDLLALYRMQNNPRFLAFVTGSGLQERLPGLRPSAIADGVRAAAESLGIGRR